MRKASTLFVFQAARDERRRTVACLDALQMQVDDLTILQGTTRAELDVLLPAALDWVFRGEL